MDRWCLTALQQQSTLPFDKPEESKPGYIRKKKKKNQIQNCLLQWHWGITIDKQPLSSNLISADPYPWIVWNMLSFLPHHSLSATHKWSKISTLSPHLWESPAHTGHHCTDLSARICITAFLESTVSIRNHYWHVVLVAALLSWKQQGFHIDLCLASLDLSHRCLQNPKSPRQNVHFLCLVFIKECG